MTKRFLFAVATSVALAAPALHAQATTTPAPRRGMGPGHGMMANLNLSASQQAQIKAIHEKYKAQLQANGGKKFDRAAFQRARAANDTAAMRQLREQMRTSMQANKPIRDRERAEIRAVLTPEQQKQFDTMRANHQRGMRGARGKGVVKA